MPIPNARPVLNFGEGGLLIFKILTICSEREWLLSTSGSNPAAILILNGSDKGWSEFLRDCPELRCAQQGDDNGHLFCFPSSRRSRATPEHGSIYNRETCTIYSGFQSPWNCKYIQINTYTYTYTGFLTRRFSFFRGEEGSRHFEGRVSTRPSCLAHTTVMLFFKFRTCVSRYGQKFSLRFQP